MKLDLNLSSDGYIQIGAHKILVSFVEPDHPRLDSDHGCYVPKEYTIYLNNQDPESIKFSAFLHEAIHAIEHIYTLELDHVVLNLVGEGLAQVLTSQPGENKNAKSKKD